MSKIYLVSGMSCDGCARAVTGAIERVIPGAAVEVDLDGGKITVDNGDDAAAIARAIEAAGFDFGGPA